MTRHTKQVVIFLLLSLCWVQPHRAQILQGEWVDQAEAEIEKHRKTDVIVIVLDQQDRAVKGATVRLVQERHDFVIGLTLPIDRLPPDKAGTLPLYRCFNSIALDRYTDWAESSGVSQQIQAKRLRAWTEAIKPIQTQFGPVISADPAKNNDRLSLLEPPDLRDAVLARIDLAAIYEPTPNHYDLYTDILKQDMLERKLGKGMFSRMFDRAESSRTDASFGVRVRNAISLEHGRDFAGVIQKLEVRQVPFRHITIDQQFRRPIQPNAFQRMLNDFVAPLPVPVTLANIEVGGPTPIAAAIKLETLLRLTFAQPNIAGITFAGLVQEELLEDNAALIGADGKPTAPGEAIDALFSKLWHSDETDTTDERGNAEARIFTGWYSITAQLPDGTDVKSRAYIPKDDRAKLIVLQVTAAEAK